MTAVGRPQLDVFADLTIEVDGSPVTVTADGTEVLVALTDPAGVLDAVVGLPLPVGVRRRGVRRGVARFAETASAQGIDVVVTGPAGVLVTVGPHATPSRVARWATGSDHVGVGPWSAVRGPVLAVARRRFSTVVAAVRARARR